MKSRYGAPHQHPNQEKMQELILYITARSHNDSSFGSTKLNKLLFFADHFAYQLLGESITGFAYERMPRGHCPQDIVEVKHNMQQNQDLSIERRHRVGVIKNYHQDIHHALRDPDLSKFSPYEISLVNEVLELFADDTASTMSGYSHEYLGWQVAQNHETIPYAVFGVDADIELTEPLKRHGKMLAERVAAREAAQSHSG